MSTSPSDMLKRSIALFQFRQSIELYVEKKEGELANEQQD